MSTLPSSGTLGGDTITQGQFKTSIEEQRQFLEDGLGIDSDTIASNLVYDNTASGLTSTNVKSAIDEVASEIDNKVNIKYKEQVTIDISVDGDLILDSTQNQYGRIVITDTLSTLTSDINVIVNITQRRLLVSNQTDYNITFKTPSGSGIEIDTLKLGDLYVDGTNVIEASTSSDIELVQDLGQSTTDAMSQKAITDAIIQYSTNGAEIYTGAYGLTWDNVNDTYARTGASGYKAIQALMKRCVLNVNGTVNYYLHPDNSTFKADGTTAKLDGTDGNVMVEIPKFYVKYDNTEGAKNVSISLTEDVGYTLHPAFIKAGVEVDYRYYCAYEGYVSGGKLLSVSGVTPTRNNTRAQFRTYATANGTGWHQLAWNLLHAIQILAHIEIGTWDSQAVLGSGNSTGSDYGNTTGQSNSLGNNSTGVSYQNTFMSYRGIENFYGDIWKLIDGINVNNRVPYVNNDYTTFADDVFTGDYVSTGVTMPPSNGSYIINMDYTANGFIPTSVGGSSSTFVPDGLWTASGARVVKFGGSANNSSLDGFGAFYAADSSGPSSANIGSGVCF